MRLSNASKLVESLVILLAGAWLLLIATPALAVFTQCPPVGLNTGCAILITINADGSVTVVGDPNPPNNGPYDGVEDTLVGLQNNSSSTFSTIHLSSTLNIFGFDGDGPCTASPPAPACNPADPTGYGGPGVTFSGISGAADAGDVNFSPGVPAGGSAWFALEEALTAAQINAGPPPPPLVVPTLSEWGLMMLIGLMLVVGLTRFRRR
jgi:IPTL-CTERM motif